MSAIIITQASAPGERTRLLGYGAGSATASASTPTKSNGRSYRPYTSSSSPSSPTPSSPAYASGIATPSSTEILLRSRPLKDTISLPRFVLVCAGIWSANFVFAFQSTAIPTLAPGISSGFQHAELSSYLGSVFALANTAGKCHEGVGGVWRTGMGFSEERQRGRDKGTGEEIERERAGESGRMRRRVKGTACWRWSWESRGE